MKAIYKLFTTSSLSLAVLASSFAQSGALKPSTYSTNPAKSPGFATTDYEAWNYQKINSSGAQQNLPFRLARPVDYSTLAVAYPLIIMLHGRGEAGTDNNYQLKWGGRETIAAIKNKTFDGFAVFPQEPYGSWTNGPAYRADGGQPSMALAQVWDLVDSLANRFNIDRNKVYIHGLSSGGTGVWASLYYRADLFAAVQIMSSPGDVTQAYNVSATPLWLHQGGLDVNPTPSVSHSVMASLRNAGAVNPASTKYTEYPDVAHTTWIPAYANKDFFPFFLRQTRKKIKVLGVNPYPAGSSVSLGANSKMAAYQWYFNGSPIASASNFRLDNVTQPGTYSVMFKPKVNDQWIASEPINVGINNSPNINPAISFTSPMNTASFTAPATIKFRTNPTDQDGLISKVEFYSGITLLYTTNYEPYDFTWSNVPVGNYTMTAKVTDNVGGISSTSVNVSVNNLSNQLPVVNITSPTNNGAYNSPTNLVISVDAADYDGKIAKVDIYNGTTLITTKQWAPYNHYIYNVPAGNYSYVAVATDDKGATRTSSPVNFTVGTNANPAPVVSITSPASNSSYASPANINITANASDADGISKVEFYNGTNLIGTSTAVPYQFNWSSVAGGTYTIIAKAYDTKGGVNSSAGMSVSVSGGTPNQLPAISITAPSSNASLAPNTTYTITASASDADGSIAKVEFYRGATLLGTDTYAPYAYTVYGQAAGSFSFTTKAYDNQGGTTVSTPVNVIFGGQEFFNLNASCLTSGQTYSISLKPEYTANATKYSWWYTGTGLTITPVAGQPSASLTATSTVTSGEICIGVNYTTSPSYKQYCKAINKCAQNRVDNSLAESSVIIDPTNNTYQVTANREVESASVVDMNGQILYSGNNLEQGQTVDFNKLPNGVYIVNVLYSDGSKEVKQMPKVK